MNENVGSFIVMIYIVGWIITATIYEDDEYEKWVIWLVCIAWPFILIKRLIE